MTYINQRTAQLTQILQKWNHLEDPNQQKLAINFMIDLLPSASLICQIQNQQTSQELKSQLLQFKENYQKLFGKDISQNGQFDLAGEELQTLKQIAKIDDSPDLSLTQKQLKVQELIATTSYQNLPEFRQIIEEQTDHKYQFAHATVSYNYGEFYRYLEENLSEDKKAHFDKIKINLLTSETDEQYFNNFVKLIKFLDFPHNFDKLKNHFGLDGLQEHTLINQNTGYIANLNPARVLEYIEEKTPEIFFNELVDTKSIKEKSCDEDRKTKLSEFKNSVASEIFPTSELTMGFEIETNLTATDGPRGENQRQQSFNQFQKLVRNLADNSSRINMRTKYGLSGESIAPSPNALLLFHESELAEIDSKNPNITKIAEFLSQKSPEFPHQQQLFDKAIDNLKLLTAEEIFIFDLFFIKQDQATTHRLLIDDIFDWRDNQSSKDQKFLNILDDIANRGSFYKKTIDMIRATEFAIGEFPIEESQERFSNALLYFRKVAESHGLRAKDRGIQVNIGSLEINLYDKGAGKSFEVWSDSKTLEIAKIIQKSVAKLLEQNPQFERNGLRISAEILSDELDEPRTAVDRVKGIGTKHIGSNFTITFAESQESPDQVSESISAFPLHRYNTGKSTIIRLAKIGSESSLAVFEIRLIGNNPHWPYDDRFPRIMQNQAHDIAKKFTQILQEEFIEAKSSEALLTSPTKDSQQISEVSISPQGKLLDSRIYSRFLDDKKASQEELSKPTKSTTKAQVAIIEKKYSPAQSI